MQLFKIARIVFYCLLSHGTLKAQENTKIDDLIDYKEFDHVIKIDDIRSGNHDPDGSNEYLFSFSLKIYKAPPLTLDPRKRNIKQEIKVFQDIELGKLETISLDVLTKWNANPSQKSTYSYNFSGDFLRQSIAEFMNVNNVKEEEIKARVQINLHEKGLIPYFHKDKLLSTALYELYDLKEDLKKASPKKIKMLPKEGGGVFIISVTQKQDKES